jgi:UDPglucose 6-dehydrogenase
VEAVVAVNTSQKERMVEKITEALGGSVKGKTVAVLGLTFKPETDDMRDAPALTILPALLERGAHIRAHDPVGMDEARKELPAAIEYADTIDDAVRDADGIVLMTEWNQYRGLDLERLKSLMRGNVFVDLRNVYERPTMQAYGFQYSCVGR